MYCGSTVAGKTGAEKEPPLGSNFNRWTDQHLQGKAITNTGSFRRDQPPTFLPTSAKRSALSKRRISPPPEKGTLYISQKCHRDNKYDHTGKSWHLPSDLHGQGRISMETRGATLRSDWPGKDQHLPTARDQPPKQEHFPLTLHCKCSQTERTHIASSKPQPGARKAITHWATTLSTDTLHYPEKSLRPAEQFNRSTAREPCYHGELHMITRKTTVAKRLPPLLQAKPHHSDNIWLIPRERQRLLYMEWYHFY